MDRLERLVMEIYEAAKNPDYFPSVAEHISEAVGGASVHLLLSDLAAEDTHLNLLARGDDAFSQEYMTDFLHQDFRVPRVLAQRPGILVEECSYVAREERAQSDIHQLLLPKYDIHNIVGANLSVGEAVGWFGISTRKADRPFGSDELRLLSTIIPHLHQAFSLLKVKGEVKRRWRMVDNALGALDVPVFILRGMTVECVNAAAYCLLDDGFFRIVDDRLRCENQIDTKHITALLGNDKTDGWEDLMIQDRDRGTVYFLRAMDADPSRTAVRSERARRQSILTIVHAGVTGRPDPQMVARFCKLYGLSRRETLVIDAVLGETSLRHFAASEGVALGTVQKQLKSAMQKLELPSQKSLFRVYERFRMLGGSC